MNTPQELKSIFDKFPKEKVELEKVELGLMDDLSKFLTALTKANKQVDSNTSKLSKNLRDIETIKDELRINYNTAEENKKALAVGMASANKLGEKIAIAAKDLGVKPSSIKGVNELISLVEEAEGNEEMTDTFINMAKKYIK
tara:strand:- start:2491 stop:2916 length:426 start_codon:yes stop_codon:yes gene_type:complete